MIYRVEEYVQEDPGSEKFPVKQIQRLLSVGSGEQKFIARITLGLMTPLGVQHMPVTFEIAADSVEAAFAKFEEQAEPHIEQTKKDIEDQLQKVRHEAASRIVRPDEVGGRVIDLGDFKRK